MNEKYVFKKSNDFKIINTKDKNKVVKVYTKTNEKMFASLIDLEGYNTGDFFKYNDYIFILIGEYLYGINNKIVFPASLSMVELIEKINITDYVLNSQYLTPFFYNCRGEGFCDLKTNKILDNIFDENIILDRFLKYAYNNVVATDEWGEESKNKFSYTYGSFIRNIKGIYSYMGQHKLDDESVILKNNKIEIESYDKDYIYRITKIIDKDTDEYNKYSDKITLNLDEIDEIIEKYKNLPEYEKNKKEIELEDIKADINDKQFNDRYDKYKDISGDIDIIISNIKKNGKVIKQLKTGISVFNLFLYQNLDITTKNGLDIKLVHKRKNIYDYSFMIMNFIKAVEIFLTYKLSKFDGEMSIYNKENKKREIVKLNSNEFKKYSMLGDMINYIDDHSSDIFNQSYDEKNIKNFLDLIRDWKDKERNGFFHKHRLDTIDEALSIILSSLQLMVGLELYLRNSNK